MLQYKNILIAVDGSSEAEWAFNKAVEVAKRNDAKLSIINVIDTRSYASVEAYDRSISERAASFSSSLLDGYKNAAMERGVTKIETYTEYGSPKTIIPKKIAKKLGVDLIMCGSTGLNAVERFIIGSVSEAIVRHAECDVLVIRTEILPDNFEPEIATDEFMQQAK
ncbi:universal stress protein [Macrococcus equipercicus]|uniref:Universal stress protein n=1 Tax=Macrococcus equipercicus TaxID=69967 RepID=A0A9Q9BPN8_9STAP|nr:universal stress protein [Macrococcus equipercicus]KAA1039890.1 universal stress protein [Macrococcus equipercicus]UTH13159.1 universal stress protein [Macrococcus equipercicus]